MTSTLYLAGALAISIAGGIGVGIVQERRIAALDGKLAATAARLNTCEEVQGIRDAIEALSDSDVVGAITRRLRPD